MRGGSCRPRPRHESQQPTAGQHAAGLRQLLASFEEAGQLRRQRFVSPHALRPSFRLRTTSEKACSCQRAFRLPGLSLDVMAGRIARLSDDPAARRPEIRDSGPGRHAGPLSRQPLRYGKSFRCRCGRGGAVAGGGPQPQGRCRRVGRQGLRFTGQPRRRVRTVTGHRCGLQLSTSPAPDETALSRSRGRQTCEWSRSLPTGPSSPWAARSRRRR